MLLSARTCLLAIALCACAGCSKPEPPPTERPPEPQAQQPHTELRDAIQEPIDQAKAVEQDVQEAADRQRAQIEAAGG